MDLSIVIPCLNEHETIGICVTKAKNSIKLMNIDGEVIVADNGSTDNSVEIALKLGAKIVHVKNRGYGNAIRSGIEASFGKFIIMGDADDSYDFNLCDKFYKKLLEGYDLVQGCRLPSGGGTIEKNAMPYLHRYVGNPLFSFVSRIFFTLPFKDVYCGFRGFNRKKFLSLDHFSIGMVFAIENLIKFKVANFKCTEIPVTLHRDGRKNTKSHLKTFSDGWSTLRFLMIACPKWLFFIPTFLILFYSIFSLYNFAYSLENFSNEVIYEKIIYYNLLFLISFQIFMFGLFSSLISIKLKLLKSHIIVLFFKIFKMRYAFIISGILTILIFLDIVNNNFFLANESIKKIYYYFIHFFSCLLIINTFFVSLITIDEQD